MILLILLRKHSDYSIVNEQRLICNLLVGKLLLTMNLKLPVLVMRITLLNVTFKTGSLIIADIQKI